MSEVRETTPVGPARPSLLRTLRQIAVAFGPALVGLAWLRHELERPASRAVLAHGVDGPVLWVTPAGFHTAYAVFVVAALAVPSLYLAESLAHNWRNVALRRVLFVLLAISLALPCGVAGYRRQTLDVAITVSADSFTYREGSRKATMLWSDVRGMRLTMNRAGQRLDVLGDGKVLRADLYAFLADDRVLLVRQTAALADLALLRRGRDEWLWRRYAPQAQPDAR